MYKQSSSKKAIDIYYDRAVRYKYLSYGCLGTSAVSLAVSAYFYIKSPLKPKKPNKPVLLSAEVSSEKVYLSLTAAF